MKIHTILNTYINSNDMVTHNFIFGKKCTKGLSFISNRQRRKEGTFCASELAGIEPTPAPKGEGYVRLDHSATVDMYRF